MYRLVLQLKESETAQHNYTYHWWLFQQAALFEQGVASTLEAVQNLMDVKVPETTQRAELILVPPSHRIHYRFLNVPKQQLRHINRLTPFLMEPYLADTIEATHFVARKEKGATVTVAGVSHELVQQWRNVGTALQWGTNYILPPQYFLPFKDNEALSLEADLMTVSDQQVCCVPQSLQQNNLSNKILYMEEAIQYLASDARWRQLSLLQGPYSATSAISKRCRSWSWIAGLAVVAILLHSWINYDAAQEFDAEASKVQDAAAQVFLRLVPDEGRVVNLSRQLQARLNGQGAQSPADQKTPYEFLAALDAARIQLGLVDGLQQVSYRDDVYRFEWRVSNRSQLEQLRTHLVERGFSAQLEQVIRSGQEYRGVFLVRGAAL